MARRKRDAALELAARRSRRRAAPRSRLLDLLDVEEDFLARELRELCLDVLDFLALATDDDAGTRGVDLDADAIRRALDEDARNGRLLELLHRASRG
jgi:hypothetical protein